MNTTIAVIAGNHREYTYFLAHAKDTYPEGTRFIEAGFPERIMGMEINDFVTVGTWYARKDADKMIDLIKSRIISL